MAVMRFDVTCELGPMLAHWARTSRDATAVTDEGLAVVRGECDDGAGVWSWGELLAGAGRWGLSLEGAHEVVMLTAANSRAFFACWLGTVLAGATVLPVHVQTPPAAVLKLMRQAGVTRWVTHARQGVETTVPVHDVQELMRQPWSSSSSSSSSSSATAADVHAMDGVGDGRMVFDDGLEGGLRLALASRRTGGVLLQSSGTTGLPKLLRRGIESLEQTGRVCAEAVGMSQADGMLVVTALSHSYMVDHALMAAMMAGTAVHVSAGFDPAGLGRRAQATGATLLPAVPFVLDMLASTAGVSRGQLASLRCVYSAGAALPPGVRERFEARFGLGVGQIYGASEFGSVTWQPPVGGGGGDDAGDEDVAGSVGWPLRGVRVRVVEVDGDGVMRDVDAGAQGQVAVASPTMMQGYVADVGGWLVDEVTGERFFLSGDLGFLDEAGRLHITGRLKLLVDVAGQKVNLAEVEAVLGSFDGVKLVAVLPVAVTETVTRLKAMVVWERDAAAAGRAVSAAEDARRIERLRAWARGELASYKLPRVIESVPWLPVSPTGKILRGELR